MAEQPTHEKPDQDDSWWQTLPGVLTAVAGILTAVTGLIVAVGSLNAGSKTEPAAEVGSQSESEVAAGARPTRPNRPAPTAAATYRVTFPSGRDVSVTSDRSGGLAFSVLDSSVEPRGPDKLVLELSVRLRNNGVLDIGFSTDSFRLLVDGVPRAPTNFLNDLVAAKSAAEGSVVFSVPAAARDLILRVDDGDIDGAELPLTLRKA